MKMPGTGPSISGKKYNQLYVAVVLTLIVAVSVSWVAAEDNVTPSCSEVDQFGNPVCPVIQQVNQPVVTGQGNNTGITQYFTSVASLTGPVKDLYPGVQGNITQFLEIAGSGIKGSINQTRNAREDAVPGESESGTSLDSISMADEKDQGIKGQMIELAEVAGLGLKSSINQTLHSDEYPSLTTPVNDTPRYNISEKEDEDEPAPNVLRAGYANLIMSILQFIDIIPRAINGSLRNYSAQNRSIWTNRSADDLIGSPLYAPAPDEQFLPKLVLPVTRLIKNATNDSAIPRIITPVSAGLLPVQPTPTPVPVPVFNLSIDSDPTGALIVLNGNRTGTTPFVMTGLEQKTYTLNLTHSGYLAYGQVVTLDTDKTLDIPLTPAMDALFVTPGKSIGENRYGGIYVTSFPDKLELTIDGVPIKGGTPFLYYGLPEGLHTVEIVKTDKSTGSASYTRSVWVYHDALSIANIDTEMVLLPETVSISPGPFSGAEFTINGRFPEGRLPATISTGCPGSFISVRKGDAYNSFLIPCMNEDTVTMVLANNPNPHPPLEISSAPDGAEIFIDGFRTGYTTPHTFNEVSEGLHRIMVSKPGLYPVEKIVTVEIRGMNTSPQKVFFPMENYGEGTIVVDSLPGGASIYFNGWTPGENTPHVFDHMKIGFYEVSVEMNSKEWIDQFELTPDKVSKVVADFEV